MRSSPELKIADALLEDNNLIVFLNDGRGIIYPLDGMVWITDANEAQKADFTVSDWEVFWNQIDDGITLEHLLSPSPRADFTKTNKPNWERLRAVIATHHDVCQSKSAVGRSAEQHVAD